MAFLWRVSSFSTLPRLLPVCLKVRRGHLQHDLSTSSRSKVWPLAASLQEHPVKEAADTPDRAIPTISGSLDPVAPVNPFEALGIDDRVLGRLHEQQVKDPSPVQQAAFPVILQGQNAAMQSYTGSGKTLAYLLPILSKAIQRAEQEFEQLSAHGKANQAGTLQAIVVAPTRELAMQIMRVAQQLLPPEAKGTVQQCIGGANPHRQAEALKANKPIMVVGTPGRLVELSLMGKLQMHNCGLLVLDEADQLLQPHFAEEMARITQHCGKRCQNGRQTVVVSATLTNKVLAELEPWCPQPQRVFVTPTGELAQVSEAAQRTGQEASTSGTSDTAPPEMPPQLRHYYLETSKRDRVDAVRRCIFALDLQKVLIFMNYQQRLKDSEYKLSARGMKVGSLHGDLNKAQRQNMLAGFKRGNIRALIVSDVAARGLDVADCDAVFNLELPSNAASYAHRAGRTCRAGRPGAVISVTEPSTMWVIDKLSRQLQINMTSAKLSSGQFIADRESQRQKTEA